MTPHDAWKTTDPAAERTDSAPEPYPLWHFLSDDWEWEYWVTDSTEVDNLLEQFAQRAQPYTVTQTLVTDSPIG